ncbi:MAG: endonuclease domain-containing protein [bacterium]
MRRNVLYNPKLKLLARRLRNEMTVAENKLYYEYLRLHEYRWLRQKPIGNYIADFYCPQLKLIIEIDGSTHLDSKNKKYDDNRTKFFASINIKAIRFWNNDVLNGLYVVGQIIDDEIKKIKSP